MSLWNTLINNFKFHIYVEKLHSMCYNITKQGGEIMKYLSVLDVQCLLSFKAFNSKQDKIDFVEYLFYYKLISSRTKNAVLEELGKE